MKRMQCDISIGNYRFNYATDIAISSSFNTFTDTATISIPNRFRKKNKTIVSSKGLFKRGDAVTIRLGYHPNLTTRFKGYIDRIKPGSPMELSCEDEMWKLKQVNLAAKEFASTSTIKDVVSYCVASQTGLEVDYDDETAKIGAFHIDNKGFVNAVSVFEVLKNQFGYNIYFQDDVMHCRVIKKVLDKDRSTHKFDMQYNVVENNMEFTRDDDTTMAVRFESKQSDNTVLTYYGYKEDGEAVIKKDTDVADKVKTFGITHSWNWPDLNDDQIKTQIGNNLDKYVWQGLKGTFTGFLEPAVSHGDKVQLINKRDKDYEGTFIVQSVDTSFNMGGGRQVLNPRNKVA